MHVGNVIVVLNDDEVQSAIAGDLGIIILVQLEKSLVYFNETKTNWLANDNLEVIDELYDDEIGKYYDDHGWNPLKEDLKLKKISTLQQTLTSLGYKNINSSEEYAFYSYEVGFTKLPKIKVYNDGHMEMNKVSFELINLIEDIATVVHDTIFDNIFKSSSSKDYSKQPNEGPYPFIF